MVTGYIEKLGYPVIKSDDVAKELMRSDESIKKKIIKEFGSRAYGENSLNTKYLAEIVFTYPEKIQRINSIVHPPTTKKISDLADQLFTKHKIVFVESALIYEAKIQNQFDYVILIYSDEQTRIKRVIQREKITHEDIQKRMAFQIPDDQKRERADFVIENNSSITELQNRTNFILNILKSFVE